MISVSEEGIKTIKLIEQAVVIQALTRFTCFSEIIPNCGALISTARGHIWDEDKDLYAAKSNFRAYLLRKTRTLVEVDYDCSRALEILCPYKMIALLMGVSVCERKLEEYVLEHALWNTQYTIKQTKTLLTSHTPTHYGVEPACLYKPCDVFTLLKVCLFWIRGESYLSDFTDLYQFVKLELQSHLLTDLVDLVLSYITRDENPLRK